MAVASAILSLVGGVIGMMGQMQAAQAQKNALNYQAQIDERNAKTALQQSEQDQEDKRRENMRQLSSIRAAYGNNGLQLAGSPLEVITDTALEQELDVQKIGYQGKLRAQGYREQAGINRAAAKNAGSAGIISGVSSLIGGINTAATGLGNAGYSLAA